MRRIFFGIIILGLALVSLRPTAPPASAADCIARPLGVATDYHGFFFGNFSGAKDSSGNLLSGSDVQGRLAVGGNFAVKNYAVGDQLTSDWWTKDVLIVNGTLKFDGGMVHGNAVYGTSATWGPGAVTVRGTKRQAKPINFTTARDELIASSTNYKNRTSNGTTSVQPIDSQRVKITLTGSSYTLNVFTVAGADISRAAELIINTPAGSTALVNVDGTTITLGVTSGMGFTYTGIVRERVLFNFHQATSIKTTSVGIQGSVLAPYAAIDFTGAIWGQMVAASFIGMGELDMAPFIGCIEDDPSVIPAGSIGDTVWTDTNGNGLQDTGEAGWADQRVSLFLDDGDGVFESCDDVLISTLLTDAAGRYLFTGLAPDTYWVSVLVPPQTRATTANPHLVQLGAGQSYLAADFGLQSTVPTPTFTATPVPAGLKVQYRVGDTSASDNQVKPVIRIVNGSTASVPLSELKARYWYTWDGTTQTQQYACDWAARGCTNLTGSFVKLATARTGADYYLELGFTSGAGSVAAGALTGEIQSRFNKSDWSPCNETNDYSYDATKTSFGDWIKVTLYRNGTRVWGTEP